jgi:transcriptional regulator GlxA family with amidase domain
LTKTPKEQPASNDEDAYVQWLDSVWARHKSDRLASERTLSAGILLWPGFPLMSLTGILESFRHAGDFGDMSRQIEGRWEILGTPGKPIRSSCGIEVNPTSPYLHPEEFDYVFVIGGLLPQLADAPEAHRRYIRAARQLHRTIVGVCTGSFVLAEERLLSKALACVHPYHQDDFEVAFPGHRLTTSKDFVAEDGIITVPGGISILSLMAQIVSEHMGADRSAKVVHQLSLPEAHGINAFERTRMVRHREISDPRVQKAIVLIEARHNGGINIRELAQNVGLSERHFTRLFSTHVGQSPRDYVLNTRIRFATWLLRHSTKSITTIAYEAGFANAAHLSALFTRKLGKTPKAVRSPK